MMSVAYPRDGKIPDLTSLIKASLVKTSCFRVDSDMHINCQLQAFNSIVIKEVAASLEEEVRGGGK